MIQKPPSEIIIEAQLNKTFEQMLRRLLEEILQDNANAAKSLPESQRLSQETITKLWDIALKEAEKNEKWSSLKEEDKGILVSQSFDFLKDREIKNNELKADIRRLIEDINELGLSDIVAQMARIAKLEEAIANNECALSEEGKKKALENLEKTRTRLLVFQIYIPQVDQKLLNGEDLSNIKERAEYIKTRLKGCMDYLKRVEDALAESPRRKKINELRHTIHNMKKMDRSQKWRKDIEALDKRLISAYSSDADEANKIIDDTTHGIKSMLQEKAKELHKRIKAIIDKDPETKWIHTLYDTSNNLTNANFNNLNDAQKILNGAANTIGYIEEEKEKTNDELMEMLDKKIKYTPRHEEIRESSPTSSSSDSNLPSQGATRARVIRICAALIIALISIFSAIASGIFAGQEGGQSL